MTCPHDAVGARAAGRPDAPRPLVLVGVPFHDVTFEETIAWCVDRMQHGPPACLATANVDFLMQATRDPELQRILLEADLVIADGMPIVWASGRLGPPLRERVTGSDLTPLLAAACARAGLRVFLLGGAPGVAEQAAAVLTARNPGLVIAGTYSPPLAGLLEMDHGTILTRLRDARPHLLLVAFGAPKQEKFINLHLRAWEVPLAVGVGGTLDFLAGVQRRAPRWVQRIGFEWLWRMCANPRRLFRRYAANIGFLAGALWRLWRLRRQPAGVAPDEGPATTWAELDAALARGDRTVVFHLGARDWLDSQELGRLVQAAGALRRRDGRLLVQGGTPRVDRLLREAGLADHLEYRARADQMRARRAELEDAARQGDVRLDQGRLRVRLPSELNTATLPAWAARTEAAWATSVREVDVDAAGLDFLDSAGLGWLIALRKRCQDRSLACVCHGFRGAPLQTMRLARVERLFES